MEKVPPRLSRTVGSVSKIKSKEGKGGKSLTRPLSRGLNRDQAISNRWGY